MSLNAPELYLGSTRIGTTGLRRALAGVSISWGGSSNSDFDPPATLTAEILLYPGAAFGWAVGSALGLLDDSGRTFFAGRIASLVSRRDDRIKDAHRVTITAADTLADLSGYRRERITWSTALEGGFSAADRRGQLDIIKPAGWALSGPTPYDWTEARQQRWLGRYWIDLLDMHLRSTLARRHVTTTYSPASGLQRQLTITAERGKGAPSTGTTVIRVPASNIARTVEWEKNPGDRITEVKLTSHGILFPDDGETESAGFDVWAPAYPGVSLGAIQAAYGFHELSLEIDSLGGGGGTTSPHIGELVNHWIDTDTKWRPTSLPVADSRLLPDTTVRDLLDVTKRGMAYAVIENLPAGNPADAARVEAYIIGGTAAWTGKKWDLDLTLGRQTAATGTPIGA